jgi:hypothetical protein
MSGLANPALRAFVNHLGNGCRVAQVLVRPMAGGFELRHIADEGREDLREVIVAALRLLAQNTASGTFRPLHGAPNLVTGWRCPAASETELETALEHLYPGFLADWLAAQSDPPPVTHYREFTTRQTGMYRLTAKADDAQAARIIRACCDARFCLKRRWWTVPGLEPDAAEAKSIVPCLEPCAVLLEFARKAMRIEQQEKTTLALAPADLEAIQAALEIALAHPPEGLREADFGNPANPRRVRLALEKLRPDRLG